MRLRGQRVVVTRAPDRARELERLLAAEGAEVISFPTLRIEPVTGTEARRLRVAVEALERGEYEAVVFTSVSAVEQLGPFAPEKAAVFAIGEATAEALAARGIAAQTPVDAHAEGLLVLLERHFGTLRRRRLLVPRARAGRPELVDGLRRAGAEVDLAIAYDTVPLVEGPALPPGRVDWVLFLSPSAVTGFVARARLPAGGRVACIGPTTARAARAAGLRVDAEARQPTSAGLVEAISAP